eukprot:gnl/TRDRNA2_/TRDRNA2_164092_c0_seq3.p2 gnl/TRDRNA2_/TRDRNA2_164092_c0~~gnl/TRDRNA2_/TRDRNA2_164092_c0_seq3.p2  ORF type:complete len:108 (-),score=14.18 gnl/TRDRNA2_/TRDRNA2_164092_c0_seq3:376-699(-)
MSRDGHATLLCYCLSSLCVTTNERLLRCRTAIDASYAPVSGASPKPVAILMLANAPVTLDVYITLAALGPKLACDICTDFVAIWIARGNAEIVPIEACGAVLLRTGL